MRRLVVVALVGALLLTTPDARALPEVGRFAGATRYETAAEVATLLHPDGAETAVVASGASYPDALAAGVAAAALDAPLLLASDESLPSAAIRELGVTDVVVIGGTAALSAAAASRLTAETGATVRRVAGANRFETAAAVAALARPDATRTIVAPGESFATALVAAVHAARIDARLLLVADLPADAIEVDGERRRGSPGDLNLSLLAQFPPTSSSAIVATLSAFPDALAASAVAGALDAPVLFTERWSATQQSVNALRLLEPSTLIVIGGDAAVSDRVLQQLFRYLPLPPVVGPGAEAAIAYDVFGRINDERTARGLPALRWDPALAADAAAWAREMSRTGYRHAPLAPTMGENIHMPVGTCTGDGCVLPTSGRLHLDWMRSGGNRDNILEPAYVAGGVGVFCGPDGTLWAVERFVLYGSMSAGGTAPDPVARGDARGFDCAGLSS